MADIYGGGRFLRQWWLIEGQARCPQDALDMRVATEAAIGAALAINRVVAAKVAAAEAYEGAVRLLAGTQPTQWVQAADADGLVEGPAWRAWAAAQALVDGADDQLLLLVRTRAGALAADEAGYELALPELPVFDARTETVELVDGAWAVRALTEDELGTHPLRPAAYMSKMAFGKLVRVTLGSYGDSILGMFAGVLALAEDVDWIDVFEDIDGDPARPGYAKQLLAAEAVTAPDVAALSAGWTRSCRA